MEQRVCLFHTGDNGFVKIAPILDRVADWGAFLNVKTSAEDVRSLQQHERTGRLFGNKHFLDNLEKLISSRPEIGVFHF